MKLFFAPKFRIFILPVVLSACHFVLNRHLQHQYFSIVEVFCFSILAFLISIGVEWSLNKIRISPSVVLLTSVVLPFILITVFLGITTMYFDLADNFSKIQWAEMKSMGGIGQQLEMWYKINSSKSVHIEIFLMILANCLTPVFLFQMIAALMIYTFHRGR